MAQATENPSTRFDTETITELSARLAEHGDAHARQ
jgi:hypothetical protein